MKSKPKESATAARNLSTDRRRQRPRSSPPVTSGADEEYRVGPGRPPREFQFKPGQSGNPKGAKRKSQSMVPDLKALFERALNKKVTLLRGEREVVLTKAEAGIERLVDQFAAGDRDARRDFFALAGRLGFDLSTSHASALEKALATKYPDDRKELLDNFARHRCAELDAISNQSNHSLDATEERNSKHPTEQ
jgi:hypothetical protein